MSRGEMIRGDKDASGFPFCVTQARMESLVESP